MPQDRMMQAIGRIERALMQLETVDIGGARHMAESSDLQRKHDHLRQETQAAIGDLDDLLRLVRD